MRDSESEQPHAGLARNVGLAGLIASGISTMVGGAINVLPLMIFRTVPAIGDRVALAYALAAVPALLAAFAYARLSASIPRAGGSYVYVSRGLSPLLGFMASFAQWIGLSMILGVVAYLLVPFTRDFLVVVWPAGAAWLGQSQWAALGLPVAVLWLFVAVSLTGSRAYALTLVPLTVLMLCCAFIVIGAGFAHDHADFMRTVATSSLMSAEQSVPEALHVPSLLAGTAILFGSFVGFETIAQAGGEAKNPRRNLPLAILISIAAVAVFYVLFTLAVYHTVPWRYAAVAARTQDLTVPGILADVLGPGWAAVAAAGVALALLNHVPAMLLSVSRMLFAWAEDGIIPARFARVDPKRRTPDVAIIASAVVATVGIFACHFAGDFFLGVDLLATSMLVNFFLVCATMLALVMGDGRRASMLGFARRGRIEALIPAAGMILLGSLLAFHLAKDIRSTMPAWFFHSSCIELLALSVAALVFLARRRARSVSLVQGEAR